VADLSAFSESYPEARGKFLDAARAAGAKLAHYPHPAGGALHLDVAVLGPPEAPNILVVGSGTHGVEGFAGSAAQVAWLREAHRLPAHAALALFHAHNPWGFERRTRVTEENVDLNRNFVDFRRPPPANAGYAEVHPHITPQTWDEASIAGIFRWLDGYRDRVGEKAFSTAFNGGQYSHADGIFYGGARAQWANGARNPARAQQVQAQYVEAFYPADPRWREAVLAHAREVIAAGLAGIGAG